MLKEAIIFTALSGTVFAQHELWYQQTAKDWNQALPVGNGRMGAMVFGNPEKERIQLNEDSLWAGEPGQIQHSIGTPEDLAHIRKLIDDNKLVDADSEIIRRFSRGGVVFSHQTLGDLHLSWKPTTAGVTDYRRALDLTTGLATTTWKRGTTTFTQQVFCSHPDESIMVSITADGPDTINLDLTLDRPLDKGTVTHQTTATNKRTLEMTGQVTQKGAKLKDKPIKGILGVKFRVRLDAYQSGGTSTADKGKLTITGAKSVVLRLTATTDYWPAADQARHMTDRDVTPEFYQTAKKAHIADHQSLYNRCALTLPAAPAKEKLPTDKRLDALQSGQRDLQLEALIFHYGRYLLIASSRSNGNPANLQGLWNPHIEAPWNSDYHLNINLQMNYWPADVTNLSETHLPVFHWMKTLAKNGKVTASRQYGLRGWMAHHATELNAQAVMQSAKAKWGGWIHGGGWMCQHIWTYYTFTQDREFLKQTGYPLLAGQARFYLDWLTEKDGVLISYPETSPENGFLTEGRKFTAVCAKAAMGQQIIHEQLTNTLAAAKVLGIDNDLTREIAAALPKLDNGLHIGPDGRLLEWDIPRKESEPGHRHLSHLYAFHPGISVTQEKTPDILEAVKKSIAFREQHGSVGIGWSRAWATSIYARLRDGNTAEHHLHEMLRTQTLGNGFNSVFGRKRPCFQIEANLGATAGIAEMLLQSHGGQLHLLPALPDAWSSGSVKGLKARGGHTIDLTWNDGKLTKATIKKGAGTLPDTILIQGKTSPLDSALINITQ
ncbi:MAG: glycoside hydrolase family 95 protein [Akkermansiaceae bacterium]|nr:glycoside hydrolase family 95 protein [Akkermansiaceae bacterium]